MLARSFKSAGELRISEKEHDALVKVLGMLERNELVYRPIHKLDVPNGFNMQRNWESTECGTVGCIRGWCRFIGTDENLFPMNKMTVELWVLFMFVKAGDAIEAFRPTVTPTQAAHALSNYLTTGKPNWAEALAA